MRSAMSIQVKSPPPGPAVIASNSAVVTAMIELPAFLERRASP